MEKSLNLSLIFLDLGRGYTPFSFDTITGDWVSRFIMDSIRDKRESEDEKRGIHKAIIAKGGVMHLFNYNDSLVFKDTLMYYINITNDSLIAINGRNDVIMVYRSELTDEQYLEIKKMISALNQKYDWTKHEVTHASGCVLLIDNQNYYQDNIYEYRGSKGSLERGDPPIPEEIKRLIDYIVGLSNIIPRINVGAFSSAVENGKIKRIISGIIVEEFHNYSFSDDTNSVYIVGGDTVSVRYISEYDSTGNIVRFSIHKPEGPLEYSFEELMADTALFKYTGGKNAKDWIFLSRMTITNKIDTLELRSNKDRFGNRISEYRKGNNITIFEY